MLKHTLSRRGFMRLVAATATPVFLAACAAPAAPTGGTSAESQPAAGEVVEVRFVAMDYDSRMQPDTQELVDAFNSSQGAVKATLGGGWLAGWAQPDC